ncbi:MAG: acyl carrier protein [Proteobacteria bacterium]|nr:acyl carrier protein [Pseudomonadota bacterium]MCP4915627.1 acyl carrier protein [Pseudomonadota bacterium]
MDELKGQLKSLIIEALMIEDLEPNEIEDAAPLFGDGAGLGLDSVDALELAMEIERVFGVSVWSSDETRKVFTSVETLSVYIAANR